MFFDAPYRQLLIMALAGMVVAGLGWLGHSAPERNHGWRRLEPSAMHWTGLLLASGLVLLFLYVRLFVGSSRADAEHQMNVLTGLIVAFGIGVLLCGWAVARVRALGFEWRGTWVAWQDKGQRTVRSMDDLTCVRRNAVGLFVLSFTDGSQVKLDEYARGTGELLERIAEKRRDLLPSA
jgi:hypothetical protein